VDSHNAAVQSAFVPCCRLDRCNAVDGWWW